MQSATINPQRFWYYMASDMLKISLTKTIKPDCMRVAPCPIKYFYPLLLRNILRIIVAFFNSALKVEPWSGIQELKKRLKREGWILCNLKGSHHQFVKDGNRLTIPHPKKIYHLALQRPLHAPRDGMRGAIYENIFCSGQQRP